MSAAADGPQLELDNLQDGIEIDLEKVRLAVAKALPLCLGHVTGEGAPLPGLKRVEVAVISDGQIAAVHGEFLDDPTPTDVITFDHGEILVSADTAAARAPEFGHDTDRELAQYAIHGLLHLAGYRDKTEAEFEHMRRLQAEVLDAVWGGAS